MVLGEIELLEDFDPTFMQLVNEEAQKLDRRLGLADPYVRMAEPPTDYPKMRRHLHPRYRFDQLLVSELTTDRPVLLLPPPRPVRRLEHEPTVRTRALPDNGNPDNDPDNDDPDDEIGPA